MIRPSRAVRPTRRLVGMDDHSNTTDSDGPTSGSSACEWPADPLPRSQSGDWWLRNRSRGWMNDGYGPPLAGPGPLSSRTGQWTRTRPPGSGTGWDAIPVDDGTALGHDNVDGSWEAGTGRGRRSARRNNPAAPHRTRWPWRRWGGPRAQGPTLMMRIAPGRGCTPPRPDPGAADDGQCPGWFLGGGIRTRSQVGWLVASQPLHTPLAGRDAEQALRGLRVRRALARRKVTAQRHSAKSTGGTAPTVSARGRRATKQIIDRRDGS